jgi:hypothetical protein
MMATTFPFGTPRAMREAIGRRVSGMNGLPGGLMLSPTHVREPEVTVENVTAFFDACDEARA